MTSIPLKPALRGWLHLGMVPLVLTAGLVLLVLTPTITGRTGGAVWLLGGLVLFGVSATYHRGRWKPRVEAWLRRLDHANIFVFIAATYTPIALLLLPWADAAGLLLLVWGVAACGVALELGWHSAPRWLDVPLYLAMGWISLVWLGRFQAAGGAAVVALMVAGGIVYTIGALIYAFKWPNPSPRFFGYHEVFHGCTVVAAACHYAAILVAALS